MFIAKCFLVFFVYFVAGAVTERIASRISFKTKIFSFERMDWTCPLIFAVLGLIYQLLSNQSLFPR